MPYQQYVKFKKQRYIVCIISIIGNILLFILKYMAGIMSGSLALVADAWHTLSDSVTSFFVLYGFTISHKKPDDDHPFGHGRVENIVSIMIATLLLVAAYSFFSHSIDRFKNHQAATFGLFSIIITVVSLVTKEVMAQYSIRMAKKLDSTSLKADGWHHRSDSITSAIILLGILFGKQYIWIDPLLSIIVSLFIVYTAYDIVKDAAASIIGTEVDDNFSKIVHDTAKSVSPLISRVHHLHLHKYGIHKELTMHICLPADINILESHNICNRLEKSLKDRLSTSITIHVEPDVIPECS